MDTIGQYIANLYACHGHSMSHLLNLSLSYSGNLADIY